MISFYIIEKGVTNMMNLEEFLDIAKDLSRPYEGRRSLPCKESEADRQYLWMSHCTGGMRGGSCWGTKVESYSTDSSMSEFNALYELYEKVCPNISFLHGRKIESSLVNETNESDSCDYYGNYHKYIIKYIHLPSLYEYMIEHNLIKED